ncbi:MAG: nicotinate-nicotinamide nucleotide adenylyltransferase [Gaiellales bacterium]
MTRVGVFGGQFDPPHNGHLDVVRAARDQLDLDRVLVIPDDNPPHRPASVQPTEVRLRLAEAAFAGEPRVEVRAPATGEHPEYTVHVLERLAGEGDLYLIIGADQFARFFTWRDPDRIRELATIVVAPRSEHAVADPGVVVLDMPPVDLSSTELRACLAEDGECGSDIPDRAWRLIENGHLYGGPAPG